MRHLMPSTPAPDGWVSPPPRVPDLVVHPVRCSLCGLLTDVVTGGLHRCGPCGLTWDSAGRRGDEDGPRCGSVSRTTWVYTDGTQVPTVYPCGRRAGHPGGHAHHALGAWPAEPDRVVTLPVRSVSLRGDVA